MRNNKQLFNSIMNDISKIVKSSLNEAEEKDDKVVKAVDTIISEAVDAEKKNKKLHRTKDELIEEIITFMKIVSKGRRDHTFYKGIAYSKIIPELESRL